MGDVAIPVRLRSCLRRPDRPLKAAGQIAGVEETLGELIVQTRPFFPHILGRLAEEQIVHLTRIALDIVKLIFELRRLI
jgi:hypothetical protein